MTAKKQSTEVVAPKVWDFTVEEADEDTGELVRVDKYIYFPGQPKNYRADMKAGKFNIGGEEILGDTITVQLIAFRFFEDAILGDKALSKRKPWFEGFFIDEDNCVCSMLLHTSSVEQLNRFVAEKLFYKKLGLTDVFLTINFTKHVAEKIQGKPTFYIANFSFKPAKGPTVTEEVNEKTKELKAYAQQHRIFSRSTVTDQASIDLSQNYYNPYENAQGLVEDIEEEELDVE